MTIIKNRSYEMWTNLRTDQRKDGRFVVIRNTRQRVAASRFSCPVEACDVMVYVTYHSEAGREEISGFTCDRQGRCAIPFYDPCPLYVDLVEGRGVHKKP
jgi:hypothetical protein